MKRKNNKKALSEIVAYVLLIIISLSLASGIYIWMKSYITTSEKETCSEDAAIMINSYSCSSTDKKITIIVKNNGRFNLNGYFIRGTTDSSKTPDVMLSSEDPLAASGIHEFENYTLAPGNEDIAIFSYSDSTPLAKIAIQPFVRSKKNPEKMIVCENAIISQTTSDCS